MQRLSLNFYALLLFAFLSVTNATAQDESQERDVSKLSMDELQTLSEIKQHYASKARDFRMRVRKAATEDKKDVFKTRPVIGDYRSVMARLVAEGTEEEADEILSWWWHGARGRKDAGIMSELLIEHHSGSEILEKYVPRIRWAMESEKAEALLDRILEASTVESVKATTSFSLLELLSASVGTAEGKSAELLEAKIESLSESIKTEYAKFTDSVGVPYGERLEGLEFSRQLVAGNPVPDIVGSDLDGVEFKLSDYNGNVVLISFWGHW